jgi:hypothetical protein
MYRTSLRIISMINKFQFKQLIEAEERVLLSDKMILREQLDPSLIDQDQDENMVFRNVENIKNKIYNFKFTSTVGQT